MGRDKTEQPRRLSRPALSIVGADSSDKAPHVVSSRPPTPSAVSARSVLSRYVGGTKDKIRMAWRHRELYLFLFPFAALCLAFGIWPIVLSFLVSLTDSYSALSDSPSYVGFRNFVRIAGDALFVSSIIQTIAFTIIAVVINIVIALALAFFLASKSLGRASTIFQLAIFIPVIAPEVATFIVWKWMFSYDYGAFNAFLSSLGLSTFPGVTTGWAAFTIIVGVELWASVGFYTLIFLANFRMLDPSLDEAARMDGAIWTQRVLLVWLPQLRPAIAINSLHAVINFLKTFTVVLVITRGGPNFQTNLVSYYAYTKFDSGQYGEAAAMATVLFGLVLMFSLFVYIYNEKQDFR